MSGQLVMIIGFLLSKPLSMRFGKKLVFLVGLSFTALFTALFNNTAGGRRRCHIRA